MKHDLVVWLGSTSLAQLMSTTKWAWPFFLTMHFIGMSMLFGAILVMDMRMLGYFRKSISLHAVHALTPWAITGFVLNAISGIAFCSMNSNNYFYNEAFMFKMVCILLAGVNLLVFWFVIRKPMEKLPDDADVGFGAKFVSVISVLMWTLVIWGGRLIAVAAPT